MEESAAALTVNVVDPVMAPCVAVRVVCPAPTLVASPLLPAELLIVATDKVPEVQFAVLVRFCVLPSE